MLYVVRYTDYDYHFDILKLFVNKLVKFFSTVPLLFFCTDLKVYDGKFTLGVVLFTASQNYFEKL